MAGERAESAESNAISTPRFDSGLSQQTSAEMSSFSSIREQMTQDTSNLHAMEITGLDTAGGAKDGTNGTTSPESMKSMSQAATDGNMMMSASDETSADSDPSKGKPPAESDPARDSDPNGNPEKPGSDNALNQMMSSSTDDSSDANRPDGATNQPPDVQADSLPGTDANAPDGGASGGGKGADDSTKGPTNSPNDKLDSDKQDNNKPLDPPQNTVPPSQGGPDVPTTPAPGAKPTTPAPEEQPLEI